MKDNFDIGIKGHLTVIANGKVLFNDHNQITPEAITVISKCLAYIPNSPKIDMITLKGDFPDLDVSIINTQYNESSGVITFIAEVAVEQAIGNITSFHLGSTILGLYLAQRIVTGIPKNDTTRLEIRWQILISPCTIVKD